MVYLCSIVIFSILLLGEKLECLGQGYHAERKKINQQYVYNKTLLQPHSTAQNRSKVKLLDNLYQQKQNGLYEEESSRRRQIWENIRRES